VLHPVGPLPAVVYWRRRLAVLTVFGVVLGGGGWFVHATSTDPRWPTFTQTAATSSAPVPIGAPALERVVPSLASVQIPTAPALRNTAATSAASPTAARPGPCSDDQIAVDVRTPGRVAVGAKPVFELRVKNTSRTPCVRALDKGLQEMVILDGAGHRLWGSNDCFPESSRDTRTLTPGEVVSLPITWSGLTSDPHCTAARTPLAPGAYVVRARLDTKKTPDTPLLVG
jgi:hypothetical protein